jgi:hypothetical protein
MSLLLKQWVEREMGGHPSLRRKELLAQRLLELPAGSAPLVALLLGLLIFTLPR